MFPYYHNKTTCPLSNVRYDVDFDKVVCYPSTGGAWMGTLSPVDLQYLNISRLDRTERSSDQAAEDAFCRTAQIRCRLVGWIGSVG